MSAVEELRLLKAQLQDIARICTAVAHGDFSQKRIVPVQGVVMVQLKDIINGMVDKLGQFAREVTRVSQEVSTVGFVSSFTPPIPSSPHLTCCAAVNLVVRLWCLMSRAPGAISLTLLTNLPPI